MAEPILWAHKAVRTQVLRRWNPATQAVEVVIDPETGAPRTEKVPQRGHAGDSDYGNPKLANMSRWVHVLRHDGHCVRAVTTMGAADVEGVDFFGKYVRAKARHFGWIPVGHCPVALVATGALRPMQIANEDVRKVSTPCAHGTYGELRPCPHYIAEEATRKARQAKQQAKRNEMHKTEADKLLAGQAKQTTEIVTGVASVLAEAIKSMAPAPSPQPDPEPRKGR